MQSHKILVVLFKGETIWDSCKDITSGLLEVYRILFPNLDTYYSSDDKNSGQHLKEKINSNKYSKIIILDHRIRIQKELHFVFKYCSEKTINEMHFFFHVYGCFIDRMDEWSFIVQKLKLAKVDFIVGSEAHKGMVEKSLQLKSPPIVLPFPVVTSKFSPVKAISKQDLSIPYNDDVLLYVGRVSPGKNVIPLCEVVAELNSIKKTHLIIIGAIDDMGWPASNKWARRGAMCVTFTNVIEKLNQNGTIIHYVPHIESKEELYGYYKMADIYVSLSTMLNEDYGMAVADSLFFSKRTVCTRWGGYKSFSLFSKNIYHIETKIKEGNIEFSLEEVKNSIQKALSMTPVLYKGELAPENLALKFKKDLEQSESQVISVTKLGKTALLYKNYELINNSKGQKIYESYWI